MTDSKDLTSGNSSCGVRQHSHVQDGDQRDGDDGDSYENQNHDLDTPTNNAAVSWSSLPRKDQLLVLTLARLSEPLTQTSLGSYLFYQLQSFDPSLPDSTISYQAGIINAAFPAAQFLTAMLWGRIADAEYGGRKRVLYIGLLGTMLSIIGFGFSHSFPMAVAFRCLGGVLNGNIGVMRTMISEIIKEKKYQSRAFLILPITFNIGVIIGPVLGA
jgi:MFS family permease